MDPQLNLPEFLAEARILALSGERPALMKLRHNLTLVLSIERLLRVYPLYHLSVQHPTDWGVYHEWVLPTFVTSLGEPVNAHDVAISWSYGKVGRPGIAHHSFWRVVDER